MINLRYYRLSGSWEEDFKSSPSYLPLSQSLSIKRGPGSSLNKTWKHLPKAACFLSAKFGSDWRSGSAEDGENVKC